MMISLLTVLLLTVSFLLCNADDMDSNSSASNEVEIGRRIFGGVYTIWNQFRCVVRLEVTFTNAKITVCSGTMISDRVILTAASCLLRNNQTPLFFRVEMHSNAIKYLLWRNEMHIHPNYDNNTAKNNLAVLKLAANRNGITGLTTTEYPQLLQSNSNIDVEDSVAKVVGWGKSTQNVISPNVQLYAEVNTITNDNCKSFLNLLGKDFEITTNNICTVDFTKGTCWGDEGGALFIEKQNSIYLVGVTSDTISECGKFGPSIYTRVDAYESWLKSISN